MKIKHRKMEFTVLIEKDEDDMLIASVPALRGCHTQARSMDDLLRRIRKAIALCVKVQREERQRIALPRFVGIQEIQVAV